MLCTFSTDRNKRAKTKRDRREPNVTQARGGWNFREIYAVKCAECGSRRIRSYPPPIPLGGICRQTAEADDEREEDGKRKRVEKHGKFNLQKSLRNNPFARPEYATQSQPFHVFAFFPLL